MIYQCLCPTKNRFESGAMLSFLFNKVVDTSEIFFKKATFTFSQKFRSKQILLIAISFNTLIQVGMV